MWRSISAIVTTLILLPLLVITFACSADDKDGQTVGAEQGTINSGENTSGQSTAAAGESASGQGTTNTGASAALIFGIGMHIEPRGAVPSGIVGGLTAGRASLKDGDYNDPQFFSQGVKDISTVASIVESHQGKMTVQAQTPFTSVALSTGNTILADLASRGHEISLHFHEDSHLGKYPEKLPAETWCAVMKEEIGILKNAAGGSVDIRYWSGGNLYPGLIDTASCAGLDINSDWKNPNDQKTATGMIGINPWRPAGGSNGSDVSKFAAHDPNGPVVYLPDGSYDRNDYGSARRAMGGDQAYFDFLRESLMKSLAEAEADPSRVSVFHFTIHPGEFRGDPAHPYEVINRFLAEVVDPLVASGRIRWGTFSEMADAYASWEQANPGVSPRVS